uniref:Uncharacterized protein n=1 Tax=Eptatretus burgeri TaxID=7764 RepID=A0A8C4QJX0_EPTBU
MVSSLFEKLFFNFPQIPQFIMQTISHREVFAALVNCPFIRLYHLQRKNIKPVFWYFDVPVSSMEEGEKQKPFANPAALEPDLHSLEYNKVSEERPVEYKALLWQKDVQLYAAFLDHKEELMAENTAYMQKHPELQALLADFLQLILSRKPQDPIFVASTYFASFSANTVPQTSNIDSL